jgi:hypothetical protein
VRQDGLLIWSESGAMIEGKDHWYWRRCGEDER